MGSAASSFGRARRIELGSRNERPLTRYFPELVMALSQTLSSPCVIDGEIVVAGPGGLDFDTCEPTDPPSPTPGRRAGVDHPGVVRRVRPIGSGARDLRDEPFSERRASSRNLLHQGGPSVHLTPHPRPRSGPRLVRGFQGAGLDGVMAKRAGQAYEEGKRVMVKVKHERTADCVVGGFRLHKDGAGVGSLLLGLYDDRGVLHHVGVASGFSAVRRAALVDELEPYRAHVGGPPVGP